MIYNDAMLSLIFVMFFTGSGEIGHRKMCNPRHAIQTTSGAVSLTQRTSAKKYSWILSDSARKSNLDFWLRYLKNYIRKLDFLISLLNFKAFSF
jgi:hypothetical protein